MELTHLLASFFMGCKHCLGIVPELRQDGVGSHQIVIWCQRIWLQQRVVGYKFRFEP